MADSSAWPAGACPWCGTSIASPSEACPNCGRQPDWRTWVDSCHAQAESLAPPGWEGLATDEPVNNLANVTGYLRREIAALRILGENGRGALWLERADELYANIFRVLSALRIWDRPEQLPKAADCDEAERRLDELWRCLAAKESNVALSAKLADLEFKTVPAGRSAESMCNTEANKLVGQWRSLAERFRRIANNDCSESEVKATAAVCGQVLPRMRDAGLIPANLILEPSAAELQEHAGQPDVVAHLWSTCWIGFVSIRSLNPAASIPNPLAFKTEYRGGPEQVTVGSTDKANWRIRAENYAAICDTLGDEVATICGSTDAATKGQGHKAADNPLLIINLRGRTATLDGVPCDVASEQALRWLKVLSEHPGEWIAGRDLKTFDDALDGARTDKLRQYLPSEIAVLIESSTGKGSRFNTGATAVTRP